MPGVSQPIGRRERSKQAKLERIFTAASELFAERGVDEVTTQQIADAADIGTGTLFLYAKTKGELLLLVQNAHYADALEHGRAEAKKVESAKDALLALIAPVVECNRAQVDNGRTYLREMVFGDPGEPHHAEALSIVGQTEEAFAGILIDKAHMPATEASTLARVISAIQFLEMGASVNTESSNSELLSRIGAQIDVILPR